ncbi:MAG: PfkB family carbohydrate kinase, partial [Pseudomonadota bacterium]|nr:PfkB family carbohydrate kinase [Pseudomonadota bacterium]
TNTLVILSQLGHRCRWGGVWVDEADAQLILADLAAHEIDISGCRIESQGKMPTSYITLNQSNGSRTIIHYRNLTEFSWADFQRIDLSTVDWIHFEGRNVAETRQMLQWCCQQQPHIRLSLEVEKPRPQIETLFAFVEVLLFSRVWAQHCGYQQAPSFLQAMRAIVAQAQLICAWGAQGSYALTTAGALIHAPAFPPPQIIDTIGAGDTFNAGIIDSLSRHANVQQALEYANRLAGYKCGQLGLVIKDYPEL